MRTALEEARTGASEGGLPIGAALVDAHGRLVVTGSNCRVQDQGAVMCGRPTASTSPARDSQLPLYDYVLQAHALPHVRWRRGHALPLMKVSS